MIFFYGEGKKGLTALVALDHDVFDGQQAALPRGYSFKHNLRRREETHNTSDKWAHVFKWHLSETSRVHREVQLLLMRSALSWAAAGHTAAGH